MGSRTAESDSEWSGLVYTQHHITTHGTFRIHLYLHIAAFLTDNQGMCHHSCQKMEFFYALQKETSQKTVESMLGLSRLKYVIYIFAYNKLNTKIQFISYASKAHKPNNTRSPGMLIILFLMFCKLLE